MSPERYQELLGRLLEQELSHEEAQELAAALRDPQLLRDLRQHLVIWDLWSQSQAPERSSEAFLKACITRLNITGEPRNAFTNAVREELEAEFLKSQSRQRQPRRPSRLLESLVQIFRFRFAWLAPVAVAGLVLLFWFGSTRTAHALITIQGDAVCTACVLHENNEHLPAIRVTTGGSNSIYYLERNKTVAGLQDYFCNGPTPATASGTATVHLQRNLFNAVRVIIPASNSPRPTSTNNAPFFPLI